MSSFVGFTPSSLLSVSRRNETKKQKINNSGKDFSSALFSKDGETKKRKLSSIDYLNSSDENIENLKKRYFSDEEDNQIEELDFSDNEESLVKEPTRNSSLSSRSEQFQTEIELLMSKFNQLIQDLDFSCSWELDQRRFLSEDAFAPVIVQFNKICELKNKHQVSRDQFHTFLRDKMKPFLRKIREDAILSYNKKIKKLTSERQDEELFFSMTVAEANITSLLSAGNIFKIFDQLKAVLNIEHGNNDYSRKPTKAELSFIHKLVEILELKQKNIKNADCYTLI